MAQQARITGSRPEQTASDNIARVMQRVSSPCAIGRRTSYRRMCAIDVPFGDAMTMGRKPETA